MKNREHKTSALPVCLSIPTSYPSGNSLRGFSLLGSVSLPLSSTLFYLGRSSRASRAPSTGVAPRAKKWVWKTNANACGGFKPWSKNNECERERGVEYVCVASCCGQQALLARANSRRSHPCEGACQRPASAKSYTRHVPVLKGLLERLFIPCPPRRRPEEVGWDREQVCLSIICILSL